MPSAPGAFTVRLSDPRRLWLQVVVKDVLQGEALAAVQAAWMGLQQPALAEW